jgi:hypothetical protein
MSVKAGQAQSLAEHLRLPGRPTDFVFRAPGGATLRVSNFRRNFWLPAVRAANLDGLRARLDELFRAVTEHRRNTASLETGTAPLA